MYESTCEVTNIDNHASVIADVLDFKPEKILVVSINRGIKLMLKFNNQKRQYTGNMAGIEFSSQGPKETQTYKGRM